jgi:hypothetical protein
MRGLRADTDAIEAERRHLFDEGQGLATRLEEPVGPREEGVESAPGEPKATGSGRTETPSGGPHLAPAHAGARARRDSLETADSTRRRRFCARSVGRSTVRRPFSHDASPRSSGPSISAQSSPSRPPTATGHPRVADHGVNAIVVALVTGIAW